jgi:hypothetical protein
MKKDYVIRVRFFDSLRLDANKKYAFYVPPPEGKCTESCYEKPNPPIYKYVFLKVSAGPEINPQVASTYKNVV